MPEPIGYGDKNSVNAFGKPYDVSLGALLLSGGATFILCFVAGTDG